MGTLGTFLFPQFLKPLIQSAIFPQSPVVLVSTTSKPLPKPQASGLHQPGDHPSLLLAEESIWGNSPLAGRTTGILPTAGQRLIPTREDLQMHRAVPQVPLSPQAPVLQLPLLN